MSLTSADEGAERAAVVAEARSWLRTPYHHMGRVKGAGVDCATLLAEVYARAGVLPSLDIPYYPPDWHLHRDAERYLGFVLDHAREVAPPTLILPLKGGGDHADVVMCAPQPADVVLWRFGRCFSHGAIIVAWPLVIHAYAGRGCVLEDAASARWLAQLGERGGASRPRPMKLFRLKRWMAETNSSEATARADSPGPRLHAEQI